jgi:BirA family biotin operon repressor/biotin-[acetyl-CoA-carboxylase] ligase
MPLDLGKICAAQPGRDIQYFAKTGSTMTEAARLSAAGASHGTAVIAEEQTDGLGRLGRRWISEPEVGIYVSVVLRYQVPPGALPAASLVPGLATASAIEKTASLTCDLRWPNDVLVRERKIAGVLTHLVDGVVIAGIGINVNQHQFPADLRTPATSLGIELGTEPPPREDILIAAFDYLDVFSNLFEANGAQCIVDAFCKASSYAAGRRVLVEESGIRGVTAGLDENGFLLVTRDDGTTQKITSGGIRPAHT